jgi:AcrR family transcriptional regulator
MTPKIFDMDSREEVRIKMLNAGFQLIKEHGLTHASVSKVMNIVGLGKGTFYHFFESKEKFVYDIILYQRNQMKIQFEQLLGGRDKMTKEEGKNFFKKIIFSQDSIYQYLTREEMNMIIEQNPEMKCINVERETKLMDTFVKHIEETKDQINWKVANNLLKIMALAEVNKEELHKDVLNETLDKIYELFFQMVFKNELSNGGENKK